MKTHKSVAVRSTHSADLQLIARCCAWAAASFLFLPLPACKSPEPVIGTSTGTRWEVDPAGGLAARTDQLLKQPVLLPHNTARNLLADVRGGMSQVPPAEVWKADDRKFRGAELVQVYQKNAPAVVLILVAGGRALGSGFLIDEDGWLLTNHHVAREASISSGLTREVTLIFGKLNKDGYMEPIRSRFTAEVYKWDEQRDLALLKLKKLPTADLGLSRLPVIRVSNETPAPGSDAAAIGNAAITLLWSLKPGNVQAVGRTAADTPELFRLWEERSHASLEKTLGNSLEAVRKELEGEIGAMANVLFVQATCPILPGDSGGPLLNMKGEAIGVTCMFRADKRGGGAAHYFIHAREVQDFLKSRPSQPMLALPSPWDTSPDLLEIRDLDGDGRPETMACFRSLPSSSGKRVRLAAIGWDLNGDSDLRKYVTNEPGSKGEAGLRIDAQAVFDNKAMRFQAYIVRENDSIIFAADLNHDGFFDVVRIDDDGDGVCDHDLRSAGSGKPFQSQEIKGRPPIYLDPDEVPKEWRQRYVQVVLRTLNR